MTDVQPVQHARAGAGRAPMRVLWVIKQMGAGGAERLLISAARAHDRDRFDLEAAYLSRWNDALADELRATGVPTHCLDVDSPLDPRWIWRFAKLLRTGRFDIVHAHSALMASAVRILVRLIPLPSQRPALVTTEHAHWTSYRLPTRFINRLTFGLDDAHIAVSPAAWKALPARRRGSSEIVVHGVMVDQLRQLRAERSRVRAELGIGPGQLLAVTVANLVREKNYPNLLRAARILRDRHPDLVFVVAGQGPLLEQLNRLHARLELGSGFRFLGYRKDAVRLIAGADVFLLASSHEGYPVAVMEALAVGVPVVATRVGGVSDAIRDRVEGITVPSGRPDLLADAVSELVVDPDFRARLARAAVQRGREFDMARTVDRIESIYCSVAASRSPEHGRRRGVERRGGHG